LKKEFRLKATMSSMRKRNIVMMNVILSDELLSRFEGTVAKIPLDLPEKKPLYSAAPL